MRLALQAVVLMLLVGCGGKRNVGGESTSPTTEPKTEPTEPSTTTVAQLHIALEMQALDETDPMTQITLVETNETGANTRHDLGTFEGECTDATTAVRRTDPDVFLAIHCQPHEGQRGVLVHIMLRRGQLVLLRAWLGSTKPNFDDFDQIGELPHFPTGVRLVTDHDE
jgi:hypothetical protein